jgi:hypothetical protein
MTTVVEGKGACTRHPHHLLPSLHRAHTALLLPLVIMAAAG